LALEWLDLVEKFKTVFCAETTSAYGFPPTPWYMYTSSYLHPAKKKLMGTISATYTYLSYLAETVHKDKSHGKLPRKGK
jgi:hypothetical protein